MLKRSLLLSLVLFGLISLSGCLGGEKVIRKVIIMESDDTVIRVVDETPIDSEYQDPVTNEIVTSKKSHAGRYSLSPGMYKKLLNSANEKNK